MGSIAALASAPKAADRSKALLRAPPARPGTKHANPTTLRHPKTPTAPMGAVALIYHAPCEWSIESAPAPGSMAVW
jgi:hypothetical protein